MSAIILVGPWKVYFVSLSWPFVDLMWYLLPL